MIKSEFGQGLDATIKRVFPFLFWGRIHPNWMSVGGVFVSGAAAWAFSEGAFRPAAFLVLFGGFFDLVDGVMARHQGRSSAFGAFLDSSLDRLVDVALLLGILMHYARLDEFGWAWLAGVAMAATVMVSYTKARAESIVPGFKGGLLERAERILILVAGALLGWMPLALAVIAAGSTFTAGQRIWLAHQAMAGLPSEPEEPAAPQGGETAEERDG